MQKPAQVVYTLKYYGKDAYNNSKLFEGIHSNYKTQKRRNSYNTNFNYFASTVSKLLVAAAGSQVLI